MSSTPFRMIGDEDVLYSLGLHELTQPHVPPTSTPAQPDESLHHSTHQHSHHAASGDVHYHMPLAHARVRQDGEVLDSGPAWPAGQVLLSHSLAGLHEPRGAVGLHHELDMGQQHAAHARVVGSPLHPFSICAPGHETVPGEGPDCCTGLCVPGHGCPVELTTQGLLEPWWAAVAE